MDRKIMHIDVNNAFLSWSAVYRLEKGEKVDIREIPSIIGGDENRRAGIVLAKSNIAKQFGIVTGEPIYQARKKCPSIKVFLGNYNLYREYSNKLYKLLLEYTDKIERYSIDECFLDMTEYLMNDTILNKAKEIQNRVNTELGFTVNIGLSTNKLLAKMASDFEKPNKVHTLYEYEFKDKVWSLDISELFMAGKSSCKKLRELNINTIKDLACADYNMIVRNLKGIGKMLYEYANGIDDSKVENLYEERKGIGYSRTLIDDSDNIDEIYSYLYNFAKDISYSLRKKEVYASTLMVTIRNYEFKTVNHQKKYTNSFCLTNDIYEKAKELFNEFWDKEPVRLIGLRATDFTSTNSVQLSMFDKNNDSYKEEQLQKLVDNINSKLGNSSVTLGVKK